MKKKIALIGNNGNWNFALLRWLRDSGYDAILFHPDNNTVYYPYRDMIDFKWRNYLVQIDWFKDSYFPPSQNIIADIKRKIEGFDIIIANGFEAALLTFLKIEIDIYIIFGHDLFFHSYKPQEFSIIKKVFYFIHPKKNYKKVKFGTFDKYVRKSIINSKNVILDYTNDEFENHLTRLEITGKRHKITPPFLYYPDYIEYFNLDKKPSIHWRNQIQDLRESNDFILLFAGTHDWSTAFPKNPQFLIEGFKLLMDKKDKARRCHLITIDKGDDVSFSKELINSLEIAENVTWLPPMYRKDLMYIYTQVDLVGGEFGESFLSFGTIVEAMLMGKPVLHYRNDDLYSSQYPDLYPLLNAKYPDEIAGQLLKYHANPNALNDIGVRAKQWCEKHFIHDPLEKIIQIIETN